MSQRVERPEDVVPAYIAAFMTGDSRRYAAQWVYPMTLWAGGEWLAVADAERCAASNEQYYAAAVAEGMRDMRLARQDVIPLSGDSALIRAAVERLDSEGRPYKRHENSYLAVRTEDGWIVASCLSHDAETA